MGYLRSITKIIQMTISNHKEKIYAGDCNGHHYLYFNKFDISKGREGLSLAVQQYCVEEHKCLRLTLLKYFGFDNILDKKLCCSNCKKTL